ncbi:MAG: hypothetical protein HOW73_28100 [Polyangiaceae bacterium]|nr:hypothetical protein [Polyangiaceae bacterium]
MNKIARRSAFFAAVGALCLAACADVDSQQDLAEDTEESAQTITLADITGKWQFVYDDARRTAVEAELSKKITDPAERAKAFAEAEKEAAASEVEFTSDGQYVSRVYGEEILRVAKLDVGRAEGKTLHIKAEVRGRTLSIPVTLADENMLVMADPAKGNLAFRRVAD